MSKSFSKNSKMRIALIALSAILFLALIAGTVCVIPQTAKGEAETFSSIDVEFKDGVVIYDDYTTETIKKDLIVTGVREDGTTAVISSDNYTVQFYVNGNESDKLLSGNGDNLVNNWIYIQYGGEEGPSNYFDIEKEGYEVQVATVQQLSIAAIEQFQPSGSYFIDPETGYYAFVQGMTTEQVQSRLAVALTYPNHTEYVPFDGNKVAWENSAPSFGETNNTNDLSVNISLQLNIEDIDVDSLSSELTFAPSKRFELTMRGGWLQPADLIPATTVASFVTSLQGYVVAVLNSGYEEGAINIESDLSYSGMYVGATADSILNCKDGDEFSKTLEIPYNGADVKPLQLPLTISFSNFVRINDEIKGNLPQQTARSEALNFGDLYIEAVFKNERNSNTTTQLYLKDIPLEKIESTFYDSSNKPIDSLTRSVSYINISYNGGQATREFEGVQISPIAVARPQIQDKELTYSTIDCSTTVTGLITDDPYEDNMSVSISPAGATYQNGKIEFSRGGEYTVIISFNKPSSDFTFVSGFGDGNVDENNPTVVTYTINVLKVPIEVTLDNFPTEIQYGEGEPSYQVNGAVKDNATMSFTATNKIDTDNLPYEDKTEEAPSYSLYYTGMLADGKTTYTGYAFPTERGTYQAHVKTAETAWYQAGELTDPLSFDIVQRKISLSNAQIQSVTFDKDKSYGEADVVKQITATGFAPQHQTSPEEVVDVKFDSPYMGKTVHNAATYGVTVEIINSNYKWSDTEDAGKPTTFTINKASLSFAATQSGFIYGDVMPAATIDKNGLKGWADLGVPLYTKDGVSFTSENDVWPAGNYKATYSIGSYADGVSAGDIECNPVVSEFTVARKEIAKVGVDLQNDNKTYKKDAYEFQLTGFRTEKQALANGFEFLYSDILDVVCTGLLTDGTSQISTITYNSETGVISVIDAGTYTFEISINDSNFTWTSEGDSPSTVSKTATILQREIIPYLSWEKYDYDGVNHVPDVLVRNDDGFFVGKTVTFTPSYSNNTSGVSVGIEKNQIIDAGSYVIAIGANDFDVIDDLSKESEVYNYKLQSADGVTLQFIIETPYLEKPIFKNNQSEYSVTYQGKNNPYDLLQFFDEQYVLTVGSGDSAVKQSKLVFTVNGQEVNSLALADTYTISITPNGNYKWKSESGGDGGTDPVKLTFVINQLTVILDWNVISLSSVYGSNPNPQVSVNNAVIGDVISVIVGYQSTDGNVIAGLTNGSDAGKYKVYAKELQGDDKANYIIDNSVENANLTADFTVLKKELSKPEQPSKAIAGVYHSGGFSSSVSGFGNYGLTVNLVSAVVSGVRPSEWYTTVPSDSDRVITIGSGYSFDVADGQFTCVDAGDYSVTFTITDSKNYCWQGSNETQNFGFEGQYTHTWESFAEIARQSVTAPVLGANRAMEWERVIALNTILTGTSQSGVQYGVLYGTNKAEDNVTNTNQSVVDGLNNGKAIRGQYYALLTVTENALNYVWEVEYDNADKNGYAGSSFVNGGRVFDYIYTNNQGAQVKLYYAITSSQVNVSVKIEEYHYGDNGAFINGISNENRKGLNDVIILTVPEGYGDATWDGQHGKGGGSITYTFYKKGETTPLSDLVNGLPWDSGEYVVKIVIVFDKNDLNEEVYSQWDSGEKEFTLLKRPLTVIWSNTSLEYNGEYQMPTATVTNMPSKETDGDVPVPELTFNLKGNNRPINVKTGGYEVKVESAGNNFDVDSTEVCDFTITKHSVYIETVGVTGHVYGEEITEKNWQFANNEANNVFYGNDGANIKLVILLNGVGTDNASNKTPVGIYKLCAVWENYIANTLPEIVNGKYNLETDNYTIEVTVADFVIVQRQLTVTFTENGASSVYGEVVNLYQEGESGIYLLSSDNGSNNAIVDNVEDVFTLTASLDNVFADGDSNFWGVGKYVINGTAKSSNYNITFTNGSNGNEGKYEIKNATITQIKVAGHSGEYDTKSYDMFGTPEAVRVNQQTLTWWYQAANGNSSYDVNGDWLPYVTEAGKKQVKDVADSGEYFIKVTADNHDDAYFADKVNVEITPKQVKVQISFAIQYGEKSPADVDYLMSIDNVTTNGAYNFSGICEGESIGNIGVKIKAGENVKLYSTGYTQGSPVQDGGYVITFADGSLEAPNYTFVNDNENKGVLTVNKLMLTVNVANVSTVYGTEYSDALFNGTTVTLPNSTYTGKTMTSDDLSEELYAALTGYSGVSADNVNQSWQGYDVFDLATGAYDESEKQTNNVGDYDITVTVKSNYESNVGISGTFKANHHIESAKLIVSNDILGYNRPYDEQAHFVLVDVDGHKIEVENFATALCGMKVSVSYIVVDEEVLNENALDWSNALSDMPQYTDVCNKVVYVRIYADNHQDEIIHRQVTIAQATDNNITAGSIANGGWTYGKYSSDNILGYSTSNNQITEATATYSKVDGVNQPIYVSIARKDGKSIQGIEDNRYNSIEALFAAMWEKSLFNAGEYILTFIIEETQNYNGDTGSYEFTVSPKTLTVTAANKTLTYGDANPGNLFYTYTPLGFADNGKGPENWESVFGNSELALFTSDYEPGHGKGDADEYTIRQITGTDGIIYSPDGNYKLDYKTATLTVKKRVITISIGNKTNTYNLNNRTESVQTLTFTVKEGEFYEWARPQDGVYNNSNQSAIMLKTLALTNKDSISTNDVLVDGWTGITPRIGSYPIYAVYCVYGDGVSYAKNYEIKFTGCEYEGQIQSSEFVAQGDTPITYGDGTHCAGKFTITQASLTISPVGVYHYNNQEEKVYGTTASSYYSGAANYYEVEIADESLSFIYAYQVRENGVYKDLPDDKQIVDIGDYQALVRFSSANYVVSQNAFPFTITQSTLVLKAHDSYIQYGTSLSCSQGLKYPLSIYGVAYENGATYDGGDRFGGFGYDVISDAGISGSDALLDSVIIDFVQSLTYTSQEYNTGIDVGTQCWIAPVLQGNNNIRVDCRNGNLRVDRREVSVTVQGYTNGNADNAWGYYKGIQSDSLNELRQKFADNMEHFLALDVNDTFGSVARNYADLGVVLSLPENAIHYNENGYVISYSSEAKNYNVSFTNDSENGVEPVYMIKKALLDIYANTRDAGGNANGYTVVYGDNVQGLNYAVLGMQNNESFEGLLQNNAKVVHSLDGYTAWESKVGTTYTISINKFGDVMADYDLENSRYHNAELTITKRTITVTTPSDLIYEEAAQNVYNGGVFGKEKTAVLTFADANRYASDEVNKNININYRPEFLPLVYAGYANDGTSLIDSEKGPTKAGTYSVTVKLDDVNYTLINPSTGAELASQTLDFNVNRQVISDSDLHWYETTCQLVDGESTQFTNYISRYADDIMEMISFAYSTGSGSSQIEHGSATTVNSYYINEKGQFCAFVEGRGTYTLQFRLKADATNNYEFDSKDGTIVISYFTVTSSKLTMDLSIDGWIYSKEPNAPVTKINGSVMNQGVMYSYARITGQVEASLLGHMLNADDIKDLSRDSLSNSVTFNAGYYLLSAVYSETVNDDGIASTLQIIRYYIFEISKLGVELPEIDKNEFTFNGQEQNLTVTFDSRIVRVSYDGRVSTVDNGIVVYATNAGSYEIRFTLINTDNYTWNTDEDVATVTRNWVIKTDSGENDGHISVPYSNEATFGDVQIQPWTVKPGYGDNVQIYLAKRMNGQDYNDAQWSSQAGLPRGTHVGDYWIKLVLKDVNENFTEKVVYAELTVKPKEIYVTPAGEVVYGNSWTEGDLSYKVDGLLYGNTVEEVVVDGIKGVRYELGEDYGILQAGGSYAINLATDENALVIGLDAGDNYIIKAIEGVLIVNRRRVIVTLGNATSQYGREINIQDITVAYQNNLAKGGLVVEAEPQVTSETTVGRYQIGIKDNYDKTNYDVTINYGIYTITARRITVSLIPGGGTYKDDIVPVSYGKVFDDASEPNEINDFVDGKLTFTVYYSGIANDGSIYNGIEAPEKAGTYTATVRGSENENFAIIGEVSTSFIINKKALDGSLITIANQTYTGQALTPVVDSTKFAAQYNEYGEDLYQQLAYGDFVNAGTYFVTLRINDFNNYKWQSVEIADREISFTIDKADNALTGDIAIVGWAYGEYDASVNAPSAAVKFGQSTVTYVYSSSRDGTYTSGAPATGSVGEYWVKVSVPADVNYNYNAFTSEPVKFAISKKALSVPVLTSITDGEGKNDVYTGSELYSAINGFDMTRMNLGYDGKFNVADGQVVVVAVNAGSYVVKLSLTDTHNYRWQGVDDNEVELTWIVAPKAITKPKANTDRFIVNGKVLTYIPEGFDEEIMTIAGNESAYGGEFPVTIGLKDKANYVWAEGGAEDFTLTWNIVGINTVFVIVASVLGGSSALALIAIGVQFLLDYRRKRLINLAIDARSQAEALQVPSNVKKEDADKGGNE